MSSQSELTKAAPQEVSCDLCILGAGIAGLNALFAATRYLSPNQKVVLVDRINEVGGMWHDIYGYVRLHQPYLTFTVGNIPWTLRKDRHYLAARSEVASHLRHCLETLKQRVTVDERYGYNYLSHDESGAGADEVLVECVSTSTGAPLRIKTKKLIKAFGRPTRAKDALPLSSPNVRSLSPDKCDLLEELRSCKAPVYIVGGGKSAMDTANALITRFPAMKVNMLIGRGTMFKRRDKLYPKGLGRWWQGMTHHALFFDLARRFDGTNEHEVTEYFRSKYAIALTPDAHNFKWGYLSDHENALISRGLQEVIKDYLQDVVDRDGGPTLLLRSGESRAIEPGSVFVNCTGYFGPAPGVTSTYEPYVSQSGKVISINPQSSLFVLTAYSGYLLTHLSYLGLLHRLPLYELEVAPLGRANRDVIPWVLAAQSTHNMHLIFSAVPKSVFEEFGANLGRYYPTVRLMLDEMNLARYYKQFPSQIQGALDTIRERFGVRCGPLPHIGAAQPAPVREDARVA